MPADTLTFTPDHPVLIIGCGNLLRTDDGVGPILIRRLWELGVPAHIRLADGGTAGMDVAFQMRGAREVVIVDACVSGGEPGTCYCVPGSEVEQPQPEQMNLHAFRWDQAIAFGRYLLKEEYPKTVTVYLIEAQSLEPGMRLTPEVARATETLAHELLKRYNPQGSPAQPVKGLVSEMEIYPPEVLAELGFTTPATAQHPPKGP